jgi:hypothetical protein
MKIPIAKALFNSYSYSEYRKLVSDLLFDGKSTGNEQSEDLTQYSSMNETRMDRLDKTMRIPDENRLKLENLERAYIWLVISEGWCGDAAQILPILNQMTIASEDKIEMKIVLRDENEELMKLFLTDKKKAIPKLIVIDRESGSVIDSWGPRPKGATDLINDYKKKFRAIDEKAKTALQLWYLKDKGLSTQEEIIAQMQNI